MSNLTKETYKNVYFCLRCGAKLTIKDDKEKKLRPQCSECGWVYYKNPVPAVACVVFNKKSELLIVKRKFEPNAGEWALPSGYLEIYQHPREAAHDELLEETGLIGEVDAFLDYYNGYSPIYEKVLSLGFLMEINGGNLQAGDDAEEAVFLPLDNLPPITFKAHRYFIQLALDIVKKRGKI
jgi:ADP-ribose pyrophosphatase YjhB (NUDIX family)